MSTTRLGPIVVGVDDSSASREAVAHAAWEAGRRGLPLRMVRGYAMRTSCLTPLAPVPDENLMRAAALDRLAETAQVVRSRRPQLTLETRAVRASGGAALVRESATASLVVIGAPRLGGFVGAPAGSVATEVVARARCPVLVVHRSEVAPPSIPGTGPVLVGVAGHPESESMLRFAFEEASGRGVPLVAVHTWSVPEETGPNPSGCGAEGADDPDRAQFQAQENAERILAEALTGWQERYPQVTVRRWVVDSFGTGRVLLEVAREVSAGLMVVGSRRAGAHAEAVVGSVSQVLISHADAPVAVIGPLVQPVPQAQPNRPG